MKPETLQALLGRAATQHSKFRIALEPALAKVKQATGWHTCELKTDGKYAGKVVVEKRASPPCSPNQMKTRRTETIPTRQYEFEDDEI